jgi:hypothetical protein
MAFPLLTGMVRAHAATVSQPKIEVRQTTEDGGSVEEGTVVRYRFTVANRGTADLELKQVKPSCGCSVARWDKVIKPDAEGTVEAEVNTLHFRGLIAKHLTIFGNDPVPPAVQKQDPSFGPAPFYRTG